MKRVFPRLARWLGRPAEQTSSAGAAAGSMGASGSAGARWHASQAGQQQGASQQRAVGQPGPRPVWSREVSVKPATIAALVVCSAAAGSQAKGYWDDLLPPLPDSLASLRQLTATATGAAAASWPLVCVAAVHSYERRSCLRAKVWGVPGLVGRQGALRALVTKYPRRRMLGGAPPRGALCS
jgi:hypothetical protein